MTIVRIFRLDSQSRVTHDYRLQCFSRCLCYLTFYIFTRFTARDPKEISRRRNKLIYLSIYICVTDRCTRALTFCIMYLASVYYISVLCYVRASKVTAVCSLPARRASSSRHCMLRPFATRGLVSLPVVERCSLGGEHGRSACTEYVKRLCFSIYAKRDCKRNQNMRNKRKSCYSHL